MLMKKNVPPRLPKYFPQLKESNDPIFPFIDVHVEILNTDGL